MSLSTLLEAAKYLDYLDSNNKQHQLQFNSQPSQQQANKRSARRQRSNKKTAANTMLAMSLPSSSRPIQVHGVPIPNLPGEHNQATSLSSSLTTGSPSSSFASTAFYCSKASGVPSVSSSAASSLSSSDSSSSCGEIMMGENDFNQSSSTTSKSKNRSRSNNHHNYHLTHHQLESNPLQAGNQQIAVHQYSSSSGNSSINDSKQSVARYIAATSIGPQLVTMTTSSNLTSASAPIDRSIRAGHVIHAATNNGPILNATSGSFDSRHFSLTSGLHQSQTVNRHDGQAYNANSFGSDNHLNGPASSCAPLIMARVQPMIINSLSPSGQSIMAFQPATASSPTSSSSSYSRHRELHKTLEKNRRAHLRHCFELLKAELPASECVDRKTSHINIIKAAIRHVLALRQQECEIDNELQRLTKIKNELTEDLSNIRTNNHPQEERLQLPKDDSKIKQDEQLQQQPPVAEQQLSILLSQSKLD